MNLNLSSVKTESEKADNDTLRDLTDRSNFTKNRLSYFLAVLDDSVLASAPDRIKTTRDKKKFAVFVHQFTSASIESICTPEPNQKSKLEGRKSNLRR